MEGVHLLESNYFSRVRNPRERFHVSVFCRERSWKNKFYLRKVLLDDGLPRRACWGPRNDRASQGPRAPRFLAMPVLGEERRGLHARHDLWTWASRMNTGCGHQQISQPTGSSTCTVMHIAQVDHGLLLAVRCRFQQQPAHWESKTTKDASEDII
jgi:hypothetical protein